MPDVANAAKPTAPANSSDRTDDAGPLIDRLDGVLVALVVLFAFLSGLFAAKNSDFWQQLAVGRLVTQGQYAFGSDPFTLAGDKEGWINHNWLFGLVMYLIYQVPGFGGDAVVVIKALVTAGLAGFMLNLAMKPGQRLYVPATTIALAILALSPRLLLQPIVVSMFFLGLTLWLLERPRRLVEQGGDSNARPTSWWLIPAVCAVWVNCDSWFVLGPITVGLYLFGEFFDKSPKVGELGIVLGVSLLACLLNPYHVKAFGLPAQLSFSAGMEALKNDAAFRTQGLTPIQGMYFDTRFGLSPAGMAYFPLILLGIVCFAINWGRTPAWRLTVWLFYLFLSLIHARAIPFFAVVAGPVTALNLLEYLASRPASAGNKKGSGRLALAGRVTSLLVGIVVLACGTLGLLQAQPQDDRRIGTGVVIDPLLKETSEKIALLRPGGERTTAAGFNMSPEIVHYMSWFSPAVRGFMDQRLPQFPEGASAYIAIKKALTTDDEGNLVGGPGYQEPFRKWGIQYLIVHDQDLLRQIPVLTRCLLRGNEWSLQEVDGRTIVFGWNDPADKTSTERKALDLNNLAFGPSVRPFTPPLEGSNPTRDSLSILLHGDQDRSPYTAAAATYLALFEASVPAMQRGSARKWETATWVSMIGGFGWMGGPVSNGTMVRALVDGYYVNDFMNQHDDGPPAALYLGLRAARRAVADNPADAQAHFYLGETYYSLARRTRERTYGSPLLQTLRNAQAVACFQQSLQLRPTEVCHRRLAELFQRQYSDLRLHHLTQAYQLAREQGGDPQQIEAMEAQLKRGAEFIEKNRNSYTLESANRPPAQKAQIALKYGLGQEALEQLQKPAGDDSDKLGKGTERSQEQAVMGANLAMRVYMSMGRVDEARALLASLPKDALQPLSELQVPALEWYQLLLAAVAGDDDQADELAQAILSRTIGGARDACASFLGQYLLCEALNATQTGWQFMRYQNRGMLAQTGQIAGAVVDKEVGMAMLRGILALEAGSIERGRTVFQRARNLSAGNTGPVTIERTIDPASYGMAEMYLGWLKK